MPIRKFLLSCFLYFLFPQHAFAALSIDGAVTGTTVVSNSVAVTLSTTNSNDIIIVYGANVQNSGGVTGIRDTPGGLTWHKRLSLPYLSSAASLDEWYAVAPSSLTNDIITVSWAASTGSTRVTAFGISGGNISTPFDANGSLPGSQTDGSTLTISTNNANDILFGYASSDGAGGGPTGWSQVISVGANADCYYRVVSSTQSNLNVNFNSGINVGTIADAVQKASSGPATQDIFFHGFP